MTILVFVKDLFFKSKIDATATLIGKKVEFPSDAKNTAHAKVVLVDLEEFSLDFVEKIQSHNPHAKIIGFLSHKRTDLFARANERGIETMPRSVFVQKLSDILKNS